jgi:TolB protein
MEDSKAEIYVMNKDGKTKQRVTFNDVVDTLPTWSPKDINLLITGYRNGSYQICKILLKEPLGTSPKLSVKD